MESAYSDFQTMVYGESRKFVGGLADGEEIWSTEEVMFYQPWEGFRQGYIFRDGAYRLRKGGRLSAARYLNGRQGRKGFVLA